MANDTQICRHFVEKYFYKQNRIHSTTVLFLHVKILSVYNNFFNRRKTKKQNIYFKPMTSTK